MLERQQNHLQSSEGFVEEPGIFFFTPFLLYLEAKGNWCGVRKVCFATSFHITTEIGRHKRDIKVLAPNQRCYKCGPHYFKRSHQVQSESKSSIKHLNFSTWSKSSTKKGVPSDRATESALQT